MQVLDKRWARDEPYGRSARSLSTGICSSECVLGKHPVPGFPVSTLLKPKYERRIRMEIEFYFKFVRKPKHKKVVLIAEEDEENN